MVEVVFVFEVGVCFAVEAVVVVVVVCLAVAGVFFAVEVVFVVFFCFAVAAVDVALVELFDGFLADNDFFGVGLPRPCRELDPDTVM